MKKFVIHVVPRRQQCKMNIFLGAISVIFVIMSESEIAGRA